MKSGGTSLETTLEHEARLFSRYLLDREPSRECGARYVAAHRVLLPTAPAGPDAAQLALVRRRPWTLPLLDAATAVLQPGTLLRKKLLLMAAILEASPDHAADLLPRRVSAPALVLRLAGHALNAAAKLAAGAILLAVTRRAA